MPEQQAARPRSGSVQSDIRNIVVVGASAGGVEPLRKILSTLTATFPAAMFVTRHIGRDSPRSLPALLSGVGPLLCVEAADGTRFEAGTVYVAPPDQHLLLDSDVMLLRRGPLENLTRPAIDPLFRSAAARHAGRTIGVLLSGRLNDGTAGLTAIKRCGGLAVVQEPDDATVPEMPQNAIDAVEVDYVLPAARIGALLEELVRQPAPRITHIPEHIRIEADIAANKDATIGNEFRLGEPSEFSCPDCGGVLWRIIDGKLTRFRCHVGHGYTQDVLSTAQARAVNDALWAALRALREKVAMLEQLEARATVSGYVHSSLRFSETAAEYRDQAERITRLLSSTGTLLDAAE